MRWSSSCDFVAPQFRTTHATIIDAANAGLNTLPLPMWSSNMKLFADAGQATNASNFWIILTSHLVCSRTTIPCVQFQQVF